MTLFQSSKAFLERHAFLVLGTLFVLGLVFTCIVLPYSYVHWIDDVMINEFGRLPIGAHTLDWNMNWYRNPVMNAQTATPYYLGGLVLELGYQLMGELGPRILMFACFLLSTGVLFSYLKRKTGSRNLAALLSLLYFSYPLMPVFVRGARLEAMVFLFVFLAVWLFRFRPKTTFGRLALFASAGGLCALAGFTWLPAVLLGPLVLWEMLEWCREQQLSVRATLGYLVVCGLGAFVVSALLLIPFYPILGETLETLTADLGTGTEGHASDGWMVKEFIALFFGFPGFFALGLTLLLFRRRLWLLAAFTILGLCACMATNFYCSRMIYFLPIALVGTAVFWSSSRNRWVRGTLLVLVLGMTALSYARTCVFRNISDVYARPLRDTAPFKACLEKELGRDCRVYNSVFALYYVGRDLGWKQFRATGMSEIPPEALYPLFDHYLCSESAVTPELEESLKAHGFKCRGTFCKSEVTFDSRLGQLMARSGRLSPILGPIRIYDR